MNLAIVTPIDERSAIAKVTLDVVEYLRHRVSVTVFAEPTDHPLGTGASVRSARGLEPADLERFDHVITVIGNSGFHAEAIRLARTMSTVVILHDIVIAHGVATVLDRPSILDHVRRWYDADAAAFASGSMATSQPFWERVGATDLPMTEVVLQRAEGVITHSRFAADRIIARTIAPVQVLGLPWRPVADEGHGRSSSRQLITIGHANANKRHELVIEAMRHLDHLVEYTIAGDISDQRRLHLRDLSETCGVADRVHILGVVTDDELAHLLSTSAVAVNLRNPPLEAASASVLEQMSFGLPTVVLDHGCYAELPDDAVVKLNPAAGPAGLAEALAELLDDHERQARIGRHARATVDLQSAKSYAAALLTFLESVEAARPMLALASGVGNATMAWGLHPYAGRPQI